VQHAQQGQTRIVAQPPGEAMVVTPHGKRSASILLLRLWFVAMAVVVVVARGGYRRAAWAAVVARLAA
jgi:hypothetical protein